MRFNLFSFQETAVEELEEYAKVALNTYNNVSNKYNQVISLQAPTGSGKTIIMAKFIEDIYKGTDDTMADPNAIFVWLSDSPDLNEQSKEKIDLKADYIRLEQCETITEETFDRETLEDGKIYFLNTQKLSKTGKLGIHSDTRQYTIWETFTNTVQEKSDHLYFVIDEAHRGMQGKEAGKATSIMQRFIKGYDKEHMPPMPVVIGMSATPERFNKLVGDAKITLHRVQVKIDDVRASGLLKDRIIVKYPGDPERFNEAAMLQAATLEWVNKCRHWRKYNTEQHSATVDPVFVVQVASGTKEDDVSSTDLDQLIRTIEEPLERKFTENQVVHTFGSTGDLVLNGLPVHHIEPQNITEDHKIRVVLFKENLSTGWDCPRAETMMSFRHAQDATYIAQLLGRMIRTPLGTRVMVDETLNDVSLFLPYYDGATVQQVIDELKNSEGGDIPTVIDEDDMSKPVLSWGTYPNPSSSTQKTPGEQNPNQEFLHFPTPQPSTVDSDKKSDAPFVPHGGANSLAPQPVSSTQSKVAISPDKNKKKKAMEEKPEQLPLVPELDRDDVLNFINQQGILTYRIRRNPMKKYLVSLLDFASLLTRSGVHPDANDEVKARLLDEVHSYAEGLRVSRKYENLKQDVLKMKISVQMYDAFGKNLSYQEQPELIFSNKVIEQQAVYADVKLGRHGYVDAYCLRYQNEESWEDSSIDCILFASNEACLQNLQKFAKHEFHELINRYRRKFAMQDERTQQQYHSIVAQGDAISKLNLQLPNSPGPSSITDGQKYYRHLYNNPGGSAIIKLNSWEQDVIEEESRRQDFICWLRNPSRAKWALTIPYIMDNEPKAMYPDFLIVRSDPDTKYVVDILEPHGDQFVDSLYKAKGLAKYAQNELALGRIQMIRAFKDKLTSKKLYRRLEFNDSEVQELVLNATNNEQLDRIFDEKGFVEKV